MKLRTDILDLWVSTDDPQMFDTDLSREYAAATSLGLSPKLFYEAGAQTQMQTP